MVRRSVLCDTCGDNTLNSRRSKIYVYIILFSIMATVSVLYFVGFVGVQGFIISIGLLLGVSIVSIVLIFAIRKEEEKKSIF
jgi:multidrug efflux pump subunit AcrB